MAKADLHTFHVPVMGLGYTMDCPLKVARYGISSVISLGEDELVEQMRKFHSSESGEPYTLITEDEDDFRAKRVTAYLNLVHKLVNSQFEILAAQPFQAGNDIVKYFELLPDSSPVKSRYKSMMLLPEGKEKQELQEQLRKQMKAGSIDVNIMSKVDTTHYNKNDEPLPPEYANAMSSLRGYANSNLHSTIVFSAGYNPRLYGYVEQFEDFFPDEKGYLKKKIAIKVSDYRSALIQGKVFAKKGIFVSEFRVESGLNCGGHAFATEGLLLGPILGEFKDNRETLENELYTISNAALQQKGKKTFPAPPRLKLTVQGGVGTGREHSFLLDYYHFDSVGWGSPFLLVPEVTNVDEDTLCMLACATKDDYYLSNASPLGIPFNNFRKTSSEHLIKTRIDKGRPGSPCYKKYLATNTEFTNTPICTASRQYQHKKIEQLKEKNLPPAIYNREFKKITEKECLCEGLGAASLQKNNITHPHKLEAVTICPGPNLAYFSGIHTLQEMADHIYGRANLLNSLKRPNMFVNELVLYIDYLSDKIAASLYETQPNFEKYMQSFKTNLVQGINYYKSLLNQFAETEAYKEEMTNELCSLEKKVIAMSLPRHEAREIIPSV